MSTLRGCDVAQPDQVGGNAGLEPVASRGLDMLAYVKRTTVKLPDALDARLRHEAERQGTTIADISRQALEAYLGEPSGRRRLGAAGAGHSGRHDVSERIEDILAAEVG